MTQPHIVLVHVVRLTLYLDFINLFLSVLRVVSRKNPLRSFVERRNDLRIDMHPKRAGWQILAKFESTLTLAQQLREPIRRTAAPMHLSLIHI